MAAVLVQALVEGASLKEGLRVAKMVLEERIEREEIPQAIETAEELADSTLVPHKAISLYCALVAPIFRQGAILSVNHDGDSDSAGSITGNLLGAIHGVKAIPAEWLEPLELREVIAEMAEDLCISRYWKPEDAGENREVADRLGKKY